MSNTQKNIPELRFPGFEDEWEANVLGEVVYVYDGTHQTPKYTSEGIKFLSVENIKTLDSDKYISKEAFEKEFKIRPEFGDILMTRIGNIGTPNIVKSNEDFAYYVSLALLKPKCINSYFLKTLILSPFIQNELWRKTLHVAFPKKINKNEIAKVMVNYPKEQEQQKIGDLFNKLDRQIELEEQKLEKLEEQKKGYMQKIFSQELRFKDENGNDYPEWGENTLGEITNITTGSLDANAMVANGKYKFFTCARETYQVDNYAFDTEALLISGNGANVGYIHHYKGKFNAYQRTYVLDRIETNIYFLKYYLEKNLIKRIYSEKRDGNTPYITRSTLYDMEINIPISNQEQQKIGDFFSKLDNFIEKQSDKVELLKERKKGFLQKMFV